ncbi:MAG: TIM barrel protein [Flavitalea sp.]
MKSDVFQSSRRHFLKQSLLAGAALPLVSASAFAASDTAADRLKINIFSKNLHFLNYKDMAEAAAEMGFDGIDLTVRPFGHVLPERVEDDLPKAVEAIRKVGFSPLLMATEVGDPDNSVDVKLLTVASRLGFKHYRTTHYPYPETSTITEAVSLLAEKLKKLSLLNKELKIAGHYQNHSGLLAGANVWELNELVKESDHQYMGVQYDIHHAVAEGGLCWPNGLRLIQPRIGSINIKDFIWKQKNGVWKITDVPAGEGMVDFKSYFKLLKKYQVDVPVSLHFEYPLGGVENGEGKITMDKRDIFTAMKRDLKKVHELWQAS